MAHLPPSTAIFSPSVARIAASTARDWNYIDSWLSAKFHGHKPPAFERTPETLKALLALASLNEAADEERDLVARAESDALQKLKAANRCSGSYYASAPDGSGHPLDAVLSAVETGLSKDGKMALDAMASLAVQTGTSYPEPEQLGQRIVEMQGTVFSLEQALQRVKVMHRFLDHESQTVEALLDGVETSDDYRPPSDLGRRNLDMQRKIKTMTAGFPEQQDHHHHHHHHAMGSGGQSGSEGEAGGHLTVDDVAKEEAEFLALVAEKKELDSQLSFFYGLPKDVESSRAELESMRAELRRLIRRRDAVFEDLVERETPRKSAR